MLNILPKSEEYGKARGCITLLIYCILRGFSVNLSKLIFDNITVDNFEYRNLPYIMVLTIFFDFWGVDLSEDPFIAPLGAFNKSFLNRMISHISKPAQDVSSDKEEDILAPETQHTSPPFVPPTDPYFTLLASVTQLTLSIINSVMTFIPQPPTLHLHRDLLSSI